MKKRTFTAGNHRRGWRWWHIMAQLATGAVVALMFAACSDPNLDGHVECDTAEHGDSCDPDQQAACADGQDISGTEGVCSGCMLYCQDGEWDERCKPEVSCPAEAPMEGSACSAFCGELNSCGPYTVTSSCGEVGATASCGSGVWHYNVPCE